MAEKKSTTNKGIVDWVANATISMVVIGIILVLGMITLIILAVSVSQHNESGTTPFANLCDDPQCLIHAGEVAEIMNTTSDPCYDLYNYACGNLDNVISVPSSARGVDLDLKYFVKDANEDQLQTILLEKIPDPKTALAEYSVKTFYQTCVDDFAKTSQGGKQLMIDLLLIGGWYPTGTYNHFKTFSFQKALNSAHRDYGASPYFRVNVVEDQYGVEPNQPAAGYVLQIDPPRLGISDYGAYLGNNTAIKDAYLFFLHDIIHQFCIDSGQDPSTQDAVTGAIDIMTIETDIANLLAHRKRDEGKYMTLSDFNATYGNVIDMFSLISYTFKEAKLTGNERIHVHEEDYIQKLNAYLSIQHTGPVDDRLRNTYVMWKIVSEYLNDIGFVYEHAMRTWLNTLIGQNTFLSTTRQCRDKVDIYFPAALSNLFIQRHFSEDSFSLIKTIGSDISQQLIKRINSNNWMTSATKDIATDKLAVTKQKFGYPDRLADTAAVNSLYSSLIYNLTSNHFYNRKAMEDFLRQQEAAKLIQGKINRDDWPETVYDTDVYMNEQENAVYAPAGILQSPVFDVMVPNSINYGFVGRYLGQALVQAINRVGYYYDKNGAFETPPWYDDTSMKAYDNAIACHEELFANTTKYPQQEADTEMEVSTAFGLAYAAYKSSTKRSIDSLVIPGYQDLTYNQAFFISFAQTFCAYQPSNSYGTKANEKLRITFSQTRDFVSSFHCPNDSPYNPANTPSSCPNI